MIDLTTLVVLCIPFIFYWIYRSKGNRKPLLPGPPGYPLIGNAFDVDFNNLHLRLFEWSKSYGDLFQFNLFGKTFVVVSSSETLRELFCKEPNATLTAARPDTFAGKYFLHDSDVIFCSLGERWTKRRKLMHKQLHSYGEGLRNLEKNVTTKLEEIQKQIVASGEMVCDPTYLFDDFIISILQILVVGRSFRSDSDFHKYLLELNHNENIFMNPGVDTLYKNLPFLRFLPLPPSAAFNRATELRCQLLNFIDKEDKGDDGIFQQMKALVNSAGEPWFTRKVMEALLIDIIGGGFVTTRNALLFLVRILVSKPDVQIKLQQEVDRVIGHGKQTSLSFRSEMHYTEAVILETLRYSSHAPLGVLHSTSGDVNLGEVNIPKDTVIIPNLWTMHHNVNEWKDPFIFEPGRFLDNKGKLLPADHKIRKQFMGFGCGKRSCVGEVFAKSRVFLFLSSLMQVCTIHPPDGELPPIIDPRETIDGAILQPLPYECKFVKRHNFQ